MWLALRRGNGYAISPMTETNNEEPLAAFVHVTDTHICDSAESLDKFVDIINDETHFALPDLVLHTGDLIGGYRPEPEICTMMRRAKEALDKLRAPLLVACHDAHGGSYNLVMRLAGPYITPVYEHLGRLGIGPINWIEGLIFPCEARFHFFHTPCLKVLLYFGFLSDYGGDMIEVFDKISFFGALKRHYSFAFGAAIVRNDFKAGCPSIPKSQTNHVAVPPVITGMILALFVE